MRSDWLLRMQRWKRNTTNHLGYPYNLQPDFKELFPSFAYSINNLGDPFLPSNYRIDARKEERHTLDWFADLWGFPRDRYWGYVTSCGTEGNLHSLYVARENLQPTMPSIASASAAPSPILMCSDQSHYSIFKAAKMFKLPTRVIPSNALGEMDTYAFRKAVKQVLLDHHHEPAQTPLIVNVNIGSTVKGATDDLHSILNILKYESGLPRNQYYIHGDAALFGMMLPFMCPSSNGLLSQMDAIATSGHKFLGTPFPCGVLLMQKDKIAVLDKQTVEYLNSIDTTMMGSRNGHAPLFMWHRIKTHGLEGFKEDVRQCVQNAEFLQRLLHERGIAAHLNPNSNIVYFTRPKDDALIAKWQLACQGDIAHVVVMPNVSVEKLTEFVNEMIG